MAELLIFIFAIFAGFGIFLMGVGAFEQKPQKETKNGKTVSSLRDLISITKIGEYLFVLFLMLTFLQINTDYSAVPADLSLATVLVPISVAIVFVVMLRDLLKILGYLYDWWNSGR